MRIDSARQESGFAWLAERSAVPGRSAPGQHAARLRRAGRGPRQRLARAPDRHARFGGRTVAPPQAGRCDLLLRRRAIRARYKSRQNQFSPRLRQLSQWDGMLNELVA
ncbi:hypothetical protein LP419_07920 [Massilia sp. H-1]|nr:hypothetical protein LP419_07920 [Massilia sp. H-1]